MTRSLILAAALVGFAFPAIAQMVGNSGNSGSAGGAGMSGIQEQADNVTDTFAGLTFQVQRIVRDPSSQNTFRLILRVIETEETGRRIALVQPAATLVDEMGNTYQVSASTGIPICNRPNRPWEYDTSNCAYYLKNTPVVMTPSQPMPVVLTIVPDENAFSPDLAKLASTGALTARFAIYSNDLQSQTFYDVVINGIALPQGAS